MTGVPHTPPQHVLVTITTRARPRELDQCLASLDQLVVPEGVVVELLVVDNDPAASARPVVAEWPRVGYVHEPQPGLAEVRNRAMDEAAARPDVGLLAFVDDDQVVDPSWLAELVSAQHDTGAGIVGGPVRPLPTLPLSRTKLSYFTPMEHPRGAVVKEAWGGNCLITREWFDGPRAARFDARYSGGGGEDAEFSRRLALQGCQVVYAPDAVAFHDISADRHSWWAIITRWVGFSEAWAQIALHHGQSSRPALLVLGAARIVKGVLMILTAPLRGRSPLHQESTKALLKGIGFVNVALGWRSQRWRYVRSFEPGSPAP